MPGTKMHTSRALEEQVIRIVVADRDHMTTQLLVQSFAQDRRFLATAVPPSADILDFISAHHPDVLVIDSGYESRRFKGLHLCRHIKAQQPQVNLLVILGAAEREPVVAAFRAGATGVFSRTAPLTTFHSRVEQVSLGELSMGACEAAHLLAHLRANPSIDLLDRSRLGRLTAREVEIAELVTQGHTNADIARHLRLSHHTIKNYVFRIFEKLQVSNRVELLFTLLDQSNHVSDPSVCIRAAVEKKFDSYLAAAQEGFALAAFVVGVAYLEGYGVTSSQETAYYWLRSAETNSRDIQQKCRAILEGLTSKISGTDLEYWEQRVRADAQNKPLLETKLPEELLRPSEVMRLAQAS